MCGVSGATSISMLGPGMGGEARFVPPSPPKADEESPKSDTELSEPGLGDFEADGSVTVTKKVGE